MRRMFGKVTPLLTGLMIGAAGWAIGAAVTSVTAPPVEFQIGEDDTAVTLTWQGNGAVTNGKFGFVGSQNGMVSIPVADDGSPLISAIPESFTGYLRMRLVVVTAERPTGSLTVTITDADNALRLSGQHGWSTTNEDGEISRSFARSDWSSAGSINGRSNMKLDVVDVRNPDLDDSVVKARTLKFEVS